MTSIIKVDTIQKPNGSAPTAADLGLNVSGSLLRKYDAVNNSQVAISSANTWFDIGLNFSNVVVNSDEDIYLCVHTTIRLDGGASSHHFAMRMGYSGSASGYVGDSSWGLGIVNTPATWDLYSITYLNLKNVRGTPFPSSGTFNLSMYGKSNTTTLRVGGESGGTSPNYSHSNASIFIIKQ